MKIGLVRNRNSLKIINRFGQPCPERYGKKSVQRVLNALRENGHTVVLLEGDMSLFGKLRKVLPSDPETGRPTGMVFNMAYGIQGECRYTHVPGMLELAGIPYTGANPLGHALCLDKVIAKIIMRDIGVPTPDFRVFSKASSDASGLSFPLVVKPRHESTSYGLYLVQSPGEMEEAVHSVITTYQQDALVEEYIPGREICIGMIGNENIEIFPLVELCYGERETQLLTWEDKFHKRPDEPEKICPAPLDEGLASAIIDMSVAAFRACHVKDYTRIDMRIDPSGRPFFLEINSMATLGAGGSFVAAAKIAGYDFTALVGRIVDITHERYFGVPAPRGVPEKTSDTNLKPAIPECWTSLEEIRAVGSDSIG